MALKQRCGGVEVWRCGDGLARVDLLYTRLVCMDVFDKLIN